MTENGILMCDLAGNWCEECGRAKSLRLYDYLTGCKTCDDVITTHRCAGRPSLDDLPLGDSWECRECGTAWSAVEEEDWCGECGRSGMRKTWDLVPGDRIDTAPRHVPQPYTPLRNAIYQTGRILTDRPRISPFFGSAAPKPGPFGECYEMASGTMVHVRPGCRCKT